MYTCTYTHIYMHVYTCTTHRYESEYTQMLPGRHTHICLTQESVSFSCSTACFLPCVPLLQYYSIFTENAKQCGQRHTYAHTHIHTYKITYE
jgi:hypothetical protein